MSINLLDLEPTIVSRDLRGKIITFYGEKKSGKTSNAVKFPKHLLLATEKGYNALNNVMAQPIHKWTDIKKAVRQLERPELKKKFQTIILDTADIAWDLCEKFICIREGVEAIGDIPYGGGYAMLRKEFDEVLRTIPLMDYGLVMISHSQDKQFTDENGDSYQKIVATLPRQADNIVSRMSDIIGYSRNVVNEDGNEEVRLFMRGGTRFEAGSRWKYTPDSIVFTYDNLVDAIAEAIEKQEKEDGIEATDKHVNAYKEEKGKSYDQVRAEIDKIVNTLIEDEKNIEKIQAIVEEHLGQNRKLADTTEDQTGILGLVLDELEDLLEDNQ